MYRFAVAILALTVTQTEPAPPAGPAAPTEPAERHPAAPTPPAPPPAPPPSPAASAAPAEPARPPPAAAVPPAAPPSAAPAAAPRAPAIARPPTPPVAPTARPPAIAPPTEAAPPSSAPRVTAPARPAPPAPTPPAPERDQLLAAALGFLDALLRGDAAALAAASSPRFSFDGDAVEGAPAQVQRWREIFAARRAEAATLSDLVLIPAAEAAARLGPPPPRLAGLIRPGAWVAVANLSGRPVILVLAREGGRWAVAAMSD